MTPELLNCPFCDKQPIHDYTDHHGVRWFKCWSDDDEYCPIRGYRMPEVKWNSRAEPSVNEEMLASLGRIEEAIDGTLEMLFEAGGADNFVIELQKAKREIASINKAIASTEAQVTKKPEIVSAEELSNEDEI